MSRVPIFAYAQWDPTINIKLSTILIYVSG